MKLIRIVVFTMLCITLVALGAEAAGEVVPIKPPATDVSVIPSWAVQILGAVAAGMSAWVMWGVGRLVNLIFGQKWQEGAKAGAITALEHGIQDAEEELASYMKDASADGKLTTDEVDKLKTLALKRAKEVATGPALQMLEQWGIDVAGNLISQLIQGKKQAAPTVVVNAANVDSISAPNNTSLSVTDQTPAAAAGAIASATVTRAEVTKPKEIHVPCDLAQKGWFCTRIKGHEGPCAAKPTPDMVRQALAVIAASNTQQ